MLNRFPAFTVPAIRQARGCQTESPHPVIFAISEPCFRFFARSSGNSESDSVLNKFALQPCLIRWCHDHIAVLILAQNEPTVRRSGFAVLEEVAAYNMMLELPYGLIRVVEDRKSRFYMHTVMADRFCDEMNHRGSADAHMPCTCDHILLLKYKTQIRLPSKNRNLQVLADALTLEGRKRWVVFHQSDSVPKE
jgi:hypothetical protein